MYYKCVNICAVKKRGKKTMKKLTIQTRTSLKRTRFINYRYVEEFQYIVMYDGKRWSNTNVVNVKIPFQTITTRSKKVVEDFISKLGRKK